MPPDPFGNSLIRFCDSIRVSHSERMDLTNLIQEKKMSKFEVICMEYSSECHENQFFGKSDQENLCKLLSYVAFRVMKDMSSISFAYFHQSKMYFVFKNVGENLISEIIKLSSRCSAILINHSAKLLNDSLPFFTGVKKPFDSLQSLQDAMSKWQENDRIEYLQALIQDKTSRKDSDMDGKTFDEMKVFLSEELCSSFDLFPKICIYGAILLRKIIKLRNVDRSLVLPIHSSDYVKELDIDENIYILKKSDYENEFVREQIESRFDELPYLCLNKIFSYLCVEDLISVSKLTSEFDEFILNSIKICEFICTKDIAENVVFFRKFYSKIIALDVNYLEGQIFDFISTSIKNDQLKSLRINYCPDHIENFVDLLSTKVEKLENLEIYNYQLIYQKIIKNANSVQLLLFRMVRLSNLSSLTFNHMTQLQELEIIALNIDTNMNENYRIFEGIGRNLKKMVLIIFSSHHHCHCGNIMMIIDQLTRNCPKLKIFEFDPFFRCKKTHVNFHRLFSFLNCLGQLGVLQIPIGFTGFSSDLKVLIKCAPNVAHLSLKCFSSMPGEEDRNSFLESLKQLGNLPKLKSLALECIPKSIEKETFFVLCVYLSHLNEFYFDGIDISSSWRIVEYLKRAKNLKILYIPYIKRKEFCEDGHFQRFISGRKNQTPLIVQGGLKRLNSKWREDIKG